MNSPNLLKRQQWGAQQKALFDEQVGVGPWGKSMMPEAQHLRDSAALAERDPQAYNRLASRTAIDYHRRVNPFSGGSGGSGSAGTAYRASSNEKPLSVRAPSSLTGSAPMFKGAQAVDPYERTRAMHPAQSAALPQVSKKYFNPFV
jgi:hypothetical protein